METKSLLYGLIGFFAGGLLVATTASISGYTTGSTSDNKEVLMSEMTESLRDKTGDDYDAAFIEHMISHHDAAVEMAKLSPDNAKHRQIKDLSQGIVAAQESEIALMKRWQKEWGYKTSDGSADHTSH